MIGQLEIVGFNPAVGGEFYIEFVTRGVDISGIVAVEELVAPAISVYTETRKFAPCGYGSRLNDMASTRCGTRAAMSITKSKAKLKGVSYRVCKFTKFFATSFALMS